MSNAQTTQSKEATFTAGAPERNTKVAVVAGGSTHERDISLRSGRRVANTLKTLGYTVEVIDLNHSFVEELKAFDPDIVWPLVHGYLGEDGSLQDLLELLNYPYIGSTAQGCRLASVKPVAKSVMLENGLNTMEFISLPQSIFQLCGANQVLDAISQSLGYPLFIKPSTGGSALGVSYADNDKTLRQAMVEAFVYGEKVLVEKAVQGTELAVSVVEFDGVAQALPIVEISTTEGNYDFDARYIAERTEYFTPARISDKLAQKVKDFAVQAHKLLGLRDLSRIDLIVDEQENIWFLDANVAPGMTDTSLFPQASQAHSSFAEIVDHIVQIRH